jgi:photosystem II stability/assembly factor-like uncharacterized protein
MKKILILFILPFLSHGQLSLSGSSFSVFKVENEVCSNNEISVNGIYTLDGGFTYSKPLNLEGTEPKICYNGTIYSVPTNKLTISYIIDSDWVGKWVLGFYSPSVFPPIFPVEISSLNTKTPVPTCNGPAFGGTLIGSPTISGINCVGNTLTASAIQGSSFQWYKDSNPIFGATNANFTPIEPGNYQVATTFEKGYWEATSASPANQQLTDVFFINSNTGWVLGSGGQIFKTTFAGDIWTQQTSGITTNLNAIHFTDINKGVAVGANGVILRTSNGGTTWQSVSSGISNNLADVFFLNANTGWAVGSQYVVLKTTDGGASWTTVSIDNSASSSDSYNDVQFTDINTGYVAGSSSTNSTSFVHKSIDGGTNWATSTSTSAGVISRLSFIDNNTGWTGGRSPNPFVRLPNVSKTADGGTNWLSFSALQSNSYADKSIISLKFIDANRGWMLSTNFNNGSQIITTNDGGSSFFTGYVFRRQPSEYIGRKIFMLPDGSKGWIIGRDFANGKNILRYSNTICSSAAFIINGTAAPTLSQTGTVSLCPEASITLQASGCSGSLRWSTGATSSSINIQNAGTYSATCETDCGISPTSEILTVQTIISNQNLSGNATTSTQRAGTITSTQRVAADTSSTYSATKSVTLSPAFQADNGSVFIAKIEGCN